MSRENFIELSVKEQLLKKVQIYMKTIWAQRVDQNVLNDWLSNFESSSIDVDEKEQINMLYLLSKFTFFSDKEFRVLLKSVYRDHFCKPLTYQIRRSLDNTLDEESIKKAFEAELKETRFVGIGTASESGNMLMYPFRQENDLIPDNLIGQNEVFNRAEDGIPTKLANEKIKRYIFIDDFIGTGTQGKDFLERDVKAMRKQKDGLEINYNVLVATKEGIESIRKLNLFDRIESVYTLDETFKTFEDESRYFQAPVKSVDRTIAKKIAEKYGANLLQWHTLGYGNCQLLFGFAHNTPDNTLPIFWSDVDNWKYIFKRHVKQG